MLKTKSHGSFGTISNDKNLWESLGMDTLSWLLGWRVKYWHGKFKLFWANFTLKSLVLSSQQVGDDMDWCDLSNKNVFVQIFGSILPTISVLSFTSSKGITRWGKKSVCFNNNMKLICSRDSWGVVWSPALPL